MFVFRSLFLSFIMIAFICQINLYRVAELKCGQLTFLMVTFECIGKIQEISVNVITIIQVHTLGSIKV